MSDAEYIKKMSRKRIQLFEYVSQRVRNRLAELHFMFLDDLRSKEYDYLNSAHTCLESAIALQEKGFSNFALASYKIAECLIKEVNNEI